MFSDYQGYFDANKLARNRCFHRRAAQPRDARTLTTQIHGHQQKNCLRGARQRFHALGAYGCWEREGCSTPRDPYQTRKSSLFRDLCTFCGHKHSFHYFQDNHERFAQEKGVETRFASRLKALPCINLRPFSDTIRTLNRSAQP